MNETAHTHDLTHKRAGEVSRAQRAIAEGGDTRRLKRELAAGNEYARAALFARGCEYIGGAIVRTWHGREGAST